MNQPLYVEFDVACRRVRVVYQSQPSFEQWKTTMKAVLEDPRFQTGFGVLLDRSRILKAATSEYMDRLVAFIDEHTLEKHARWAIVTSDLDSFRMGQKAEQSTDNANIRAFKDRSEAERWLAD
jgi:hypothetical protein